ncbi:MAG: anti-sigma factor family protein [Pyrinomonadaceae bacterium]
MEERSSAPICERGNDLVAFLYGEIDQSDAPDFERHLKSCVECKRELNAFREIRESIVAWRDESLSLAPAPAVAFSEAADSPTLRPVVRRRSAMAAIRQFFDLSPLWMKGAVAFASVLFCALAVLAVARLFDRQHPVVANGEKLYTESDVAKKVDEAVQSTLRDLNANRKDTSAPPDEATGPKPRTEGRAPDHSSEIANDGPKARRPLTKSEREQLAADLRLISPKNETDLDLLGDRLNQ